MGRIKYELGNVWKEVKLTGRLLKQDAPAIPLWYGARTLVRRIPGTKAYFYDELKHRLVFKYDEFEYLIQKTFNFKDMGQLISTTSSVEKGVGGFFTWFEDFGWIVGGPGIGIPILGFPKKGGGVSVFTPKLGEIQSVEALSLKGIKSTAVTIFAFIGSILILKVSLQAFTILIGAIEMSESTPIPTIASDFYVLYGLVFVAFIIIFLVMYMFKILNIYDLSFLNRRR